MFLYEHPPPLNVLFVYYNLFGGYGRKTIEPA